MKKVLVSLLIMSILMTTALTAFAVPTINYTFKNADTVYIFGKLGTNANETAGEALATDYTLELTDKDNNEFDIVVGDIDEVKIANIKGANLFGFAITDDAGKLDDKFIVRPSFVAPSIITNNNKQVKAYGEYFEVDPTNETVAQLTNMSCEDVSSDADYDTGLAKLNGAVNLKTGAVTYNDKGLTLSSLYSPVLKFDISHIPATAEKVTFSIGTNKSYTAAKAFLDDDFIMDVYKIDADILDKDWTYTSASSYSWDTMSSKAEGYKTIIDEANKIGSMTSADVEKVTYRENATSNITSAMAGVRAVVDITDAVVEAKAAGENTLSIAVVLAQAPNHAGATDSTSTDANFYLRSLAYVSGTTFGARASKMIAPRIDYVK